MGQWFDSAQGLDGTDEGTTLEYDVVGAGGTFTNSI
jgi:hypothetical protein